MSRIIELRKIATEFGVQLSELGPDIDIEDRINHSYAYGCDEIALGIYEDEELLVISFFHELGHCVGSLPPYEECQYDHYKEARAWRVGLALAADRGITFSSRALEWAREQLTSYFKEDCPEHSPLKFLPEALREAGLR